MGLGNKLIVSASGFPGTNKTLRFIQDAFREPLGALAQLAGDKTIISGVVVDIPNNWVSNGFITYNGEIIPFQGGNYAATVTIIEAFENVNYNTDANDDTVLDSLPAYRTIYAMCGTGGIDIFNFSDLTALKTVKELSTFTLPANIVVDPANLILIPAEKTVLERLIELEKKNAIFQLGGGMVLWNKPAIDIPFGWHEVVDWRGRMPIGMDIGNPKFNTLGHNEGSDTATIAMENLPSSLNISATILNDAGSSLGIKTDINVWAHTVTISGANDVALNIMNPYRTVLFIEYTGL